jgi:hypothetical protein
MGPFRIIHMDIPGAIVHGKVSDLKLKLAVVMVGSLQIELLESLEGENIYTEFLREKGEGLHHLGIGVDDVDREVAELEKGGVGVLQQGKVNGRSFAYLDTAGIGGAIIELVPRVRS